MIRRPPRSTLSSSSAASDVYKRQEAYGPLAQPQAAHRVVSSQWVIPGRGHTGGDGWVVELPGFVVDVLAPPAHVKLKGVSKVDVRANVVMMCGCPIEPGALWDGDKYE